MKNLFYYVYNNKMTTKVEHVLKAPFTEGDYFHTTNPYYYGVKRPTIAPNLGRPFNHSPFLSQINAVGFSNLPKVPTVQSYADARFDMDTRGWFQVNQPQNKPFWGSPFDLQINGAKSDQAAPFYQASQNLLNTETIQKEVDLGTEIKSAETSRKFQEAVTFIPTIFQKISKFSNDKLSNPNLKITDYITAAEQEYLNSLNKKSTIDIKELIAQIEALTGNQILPTPAPTTTIGNLTPSLIPDPIEIPAVEVIKPTEDEVELPEDEVEPPEDEVEPPEAPESPTSTLMKIQSDLKDNLIEKIKSLQGSDIRKYMNKVETIEKVIDIIKDEFRKEKEELKAKSTTLTLDDVLNRINSNPDIEKVSKEEVRQYIQLIKLKRKNKDVPLNSLLNLIKETQREQRELMGMKAQDVNVGDIDAIREEDGEDMPSLESDREEENEDDESMNFVETELRDTLPRLLENKTTFINEINNREVYLSKDAIKYNSKGDLIVAYRVKKNGALSKGINAETLYKRLKEGREFEYKDNKIILLLN